MILVQDIIDRVAASLDAEGSGYFNFSRDYEPAINNAIEWVVSSVSPLIGTNKFPEEAFRELTTTKVWQCNRYSGFIIDPADIGGRDYWTILGVYAKPKVVLLDAPNLATTLPGIYYSEIFPYLGQELVNAPVVSQAYNATGINLLQPQQSTFRPELAFVDCANMCDRITLKEWSSRQRNKFSPGYKSKVAKYIQWAYINANNYTSTIGGYTLSVPREIRVSPDLSRDLVGVTYIAIPATISSPADIIGFPQTLFVPMVQKALNYISIKENMGAQLYNITTQELLQALNAL